MQNNVDEIFDVVIVGGGPGGYSAAIRAAQLGGKIALVEGKNLGGVCLNEGCIPTKFLLHFSDLYKEIQHSNKFGLDIKNITFSQQILLDKKNLVINRLVKGLTLILNKYSIKVISGEGALLNANTVEVLDDQGNAILIKGNNIIIATGSTISKPPIPGIDLSGVITSEDALDLNNIPKSLVIVGGGPEGVEFADIFSNLGSKVTVIEMLPQLLPSQDSEIALELETIFKKKNIQIYKNSKVSSISANSDNSLLVNIQNDNEKNDISCDLVLLATGRKPNTYDIGLEELGIKFSNSIIETNDCMMTNIPNIYVIGDAAGKYLYAYTAFYEGEIAAEHAMGKNSKINYQHIPSTIFTNPELASVGLTEEQTKQLKLEIKIGRFPFRASGKAISLGKTDGFVKIIVDKNNDKILGVHIIGHNAAEIIHEAVICLNLQATVKDLANTIHSHPTFAEALREAALDVDNLSIHKM